MAKIASTPAIHPIAELFPRMSDAEQAELTADIKANGLGRPISRFDGMILDGRHRWQGCDDSGVKPRYEDLSETCDPFAYVISHNLRHRHLSESQRAMVGEQIAAMKIVLQNTGPNRAPIGASESNGKRAAQESAAKAVNVGVRSIQRAAKVADKSTPEIIAAVRDGTVKVSDAAAIADESPKVQAKALDRVVKGEASTLKKAIAGKQGKPPPEPKPKPSDFADAHTYFGRGAKKIEALNKAHPGADKFAVKSRRLLSELLTTIHDWQKAVR